jgi:chaperonin GroES
MGFRPFADRVLVKLHDQKEVKTPSGIVLPESSAKFRTAEVVAIGRGQVSAEGTITPLEAKVGDIVQLIAHGGDDMTIGSDKFLLVSERLIVGIIDDKTQKPAPKMVRLLSESKS